MTPRCALCGRLTLKPVLVYGTTKTPTAVGPKCARRAGLIVPKRRAARVCGRAPVMRDDGTPDMFAEAA